MDQSHPSRRSFLAAVGNLASATWIAANWTAIAAAAEPMQHGSHEASQHTTLTTLSPAEAAEIDAISNLIVPAGATPGARDAHVTVFIDNALGSFFASQLPSFREGLTRRSCRAHCR